MSGPTEYKIETVMDMLAVPADKWPEMLADFQLWLELRAEMQALVDAGLMKCEPFILWTDDGIRGLAKLELEVVDSIAPGCGDAGEA